MTYTISKTHSFSASHRLTGLPDEHPCSRLHGHNYRVRLSVTATELDAVGFVIDYHDLDTFFTFIDDRLDHRHLNDLLPHNPTAENLSLWLHEQATLILPDQYRYEVAVSETDKTWATWTP